MKVYYHEWNWCDDDGSSLVFYSKEFGSLEFFDDGFFAQYDTRTEIFESNRVEAVFSYLGEL